MEDLVTEKSGNWSGRKVLVTGHTGFKGAWLCVWLHALGARVTGLSLDPPTRTNLYEEADVARLVERDIRGDLNDFQTTANALALSRPEVIFHLAAQSLVRESYRDPLLTWRTNCIGTANLLEAARSVSSPAAIVLVTTDKVYRNDETGRSYGEGDALGGHDPYSASKAAAELVGDSYRRSFFGPGGDHPALLATARSGNVIGGGDWAEDRLVPDCLEAFARGDSVKLRHPGAVRPWQHVLAPLSGYLSLAEALLGENGPPFAASWNFGPDAPDEWPVGQVAQAVAECWGDGARVVLDTSEQHPHEAGLLRLDSTRARTLLDWRPRWGLQEAIEATVDWHQAWRAGQSALQLTTGQIERYVSRA